MNTCIRLVSQLRFVPLIKNHANIRQIFSPVSVGLPEFIEAKNKYLSLSEETKGKFRERLEVIALGNEHELVFTDDLKQLIYIAEPNDRDLELLYKTLAKQNASLRFGNFVFGPVIMRMFHYMNNPDEALKAYNNPEFDGMFDQLSSHLVLVDLLFKNKMYDELINVYKSMRERQLTFGKHPRNMLIPVFGALYKMNTETAYNYSQELWKEINEKGSMPVRRAICFIAATALNQNNPHVCLEILSTIPNQNYILVRSFKTLAYCALGRTSDALLVLATVLCVDTPNVTKHTFPRDVISTVKECVEKEDRKDLTFEFNRLQKQLEDFGHISDQTLDEKLTSKITFFNPVDHDKSMIRATFHNAVPMMKTRFLRPGLQELI